MLFKCIATFVVLALLQNQVLGNVGYKYGYKYPPLIPGCHPPVWHPPIYHPPVYPHHPCRPCPGHIVIPPRPVYPAPVPIPQPIVVPPVPLPHPCVLPPKPWVPPVKIIKEKSYCHPKPVPVIIPVPVPISGGCPPHPC